ncbi:MAG: thiamine ABC transporter substrate-binding protein [Treponema sp. CETP13]|nr:MAG: thiamine ABC transporter substrate-binding protein [Treponema sp. CETP13]
MTFAGGSKETSISDSRAKEVVVYTYDSFIADWGPGPELKRLFEEKTGNTVTFISVGDGAQILSKAVLEKKAPQADVLLGIDNNQIELAKKSNVMVNFKPMNADVIDSVLSLDKDWLMTPYDWSYFALIYDTQSTVPAPSCLQDLTKSEYEKKIVLMDPRTSTPGLGFAAWTVAVFGDSYLDYWKALQKNILTMAPNWDTGYGLFTSGEAPLVISYTTSPAYHVEYDNTDRYKALIFPEGHIMQIEGAGLVKNAPNAEGGKAFIEFLISTEAQNVLPLTQWMYPVNKDVKLPSCYDAAPMADTKLSVDNEKLNVAVTEITNTLAE